MSVNFLEKIRSHVIRRVELMPDSLIEIQIHWISARYSPHLQNLSLLAR